MQESTQHNQKNQSREAYWRKAYEDWQRSGETQLAYCQRLKIN
jgi:hypothetical protein